MPWTEADDKILNGGGGSPPAPRSLWRRLVDGITEGAVNSPLGAEPVARQMLKNKGHEEEDIDAAERKLIERLERQRQFEDETLFKDVDTFSPANIGKHAIDLLGNIIGGADPTYVIGGPAKSAAGRILTQGGINAGVDAGNQGIQIERGIRDEYNPIQTGINAAAGVGIQGGREVADALRGRVPLSIDSAKTIGNKFGTVTSTLRSPAKNKKVGGAKNSHHLRGTAIDIARGKGVTHRQLEAAYRRAGFDIIESLDEGDHSHFAFRFGKAKSPKKGGGVIEDFDFRPTEMRGLAELERLAKLGRESSERAAELSAKQDLEPDFKLPTIEQLDERINTRLNQRQIDDLERIQKEAPILDSSHEKFTPYVDTNNLRADNDPVFMGSHSNPDENAFPDIFLETPEAKRAKTFLNENTKDYNIKQLMEMTNEDAIALAKSKGFNKAWDDFYRTVKWDPKTKDLIVDPNHPRPNLSLMEDVLTPAERQEMDASATRPEVPPITLKGLGKGSVATTPVNDLGSVSRDGSDLYPRPAYPGEKGFPKPGEPGNRGGPKGGGDEPVDPEKKLIEALKKAVPLNTEKRRLQHEERSRRDKVLRDIQRQGGSKKNYYSQLKALKGQLPKVDFESFAKDFSDEDLNALLSKITDSPKLLSYERVTAQGAIIELLDGKLPTSGEIKLLNEVFSPELIRELLKTRTGREKFWANFSNAINVPRSLMASFDLSAPFRQGVFMIGRKEFWKAWGSMFRSFGSDKAYESIMREIHDRPTYHLMKKSGLAFSDPKSQILDEREEQFMSNWAEKVPLGVGKGVEMSNRAYSAFLNKLRADVFDSLYHKGQDLGVDFGPDSNTAKDLAKFINAGTGRGSLNQMLGKHGDAAAPFLSGLLFSPRLMASRISMLNPYFYATLDPFVRKEALKSLVTFAGTATTVLTLAKMGGAEVENDPRSSDFGKIKVGNTRYDILGGFQQYLRFVAQFISGQQKTLKGDVKELERGFGKDTRFTKFIDFIRSKAAPVPAYVGDWMDGENLIGEEFKPTKDAVESFIPLFAQDLAEALKEEGFPEGLKGLLPSLVGVGVQTYEPKPTKEQKKQAKEDLGVEPFDVKEWDF